MPCNSDYMDASPFETWASRVACLIDELDGKTWEKSWWDGYHPRIYNARVLAGAMVTELYTRLQSTDVAKCSLEMQTWWRDHLKADAARVQAIIDAANTKAERAGALSKLTQRERNLLGVK